MARKRTEAVKPALAAAMAMAIALVGSPAAAQAPGRQKMPKVRSAAGSARRQPVPLVALDEQYTEWLAAADTLRDEGSYAEAVRAYQALIVKGGRAVIAGGADGELADDSGALRRRFLSIPRVAANRIGALGPEGIAAYRSQFDAPARQLLDQGRRELDRKSLGRVAAHYFHTTCGDEAVVFLGRMQFDRGRYGRAARSFQRALDRKSPPSVRRDVLLAEAAVAWHRAGVATLRDKRLDELRADSPHAAAVLAGRRQNILTFALGLCDQAIGRPADEPVVMKDRWPGLGGLGDGLAVMADCDVVLTPHWRYPRSDRLIGQPVMFLFDRTGGWGASRGMNLQAALRDGHVQISADGGAEWVLAPAVTHPVAVDGAVMIRTHEAIVAVDLISGAPLWRSAELPVARRPRTPAYRPDGFSMADPGRYGLTLAGDLIFAVGDYPPPPETDRRGRMATGPSNTSYLAAVSRSKKGRIVWTCGAGRGDDELLASGEYLGSPACVGGRVYVMIRHAQSFYLACLNAADGKRVWISLIGQAPVTGNRSAGRFVTAASPPAVSGGRVYVTTNAGLIAAVDAETGAALWMHQYDGRRGATTRRSGAYRLMAPANPLIVVGDTVISLPADSRDVLALAADSGREVWTTRAGGQWRLTAMTGGRVLLSDPGLVVLDVGDGRTTYRLGGGASLSGRPAVTSDSICISGVGEIIVVHTDTEPFAVDRLPLGDSHAVLGNLVSVGGRLVAATAGVVCAYADFQRIYDGLTARVAAAAGAERTELLFERGRLALTAGRPAAALGDFMHVRQAAEAVGDRARIAAAADWLRRVYIGLGDRGAAAADMAKWYELALAETMARSSRGEMVVRLLRCDEQAGRTAAAARRAMELVDTYADVMFRDVPIGEAARRRGGDILSERGEAIGQRHVARLIADHGRQAYAAFDGEARVACEQAKAAGDADALLALRRRYRHSLWAGHMLLAAAEKLYTDAIAAGPVDTAGLHRARKALFELERYRDSPVTLSGLAGRALVQLRLSPRAARSIYTGPLGQVRPAARVKFGDFDGHVDQLLLKLAAGVADAPPSPPAARMAGPMRVVYSVADPSLLVIRDGRRRPIRSGSRLFLRSDDHVLCLDVKADRFADGSGIVWRAAVGGSGDEGFEPNSRMMVGHLLDDGRTLMLADMAAITLLDAADGKILDRRRLSSFGVKKAAAIAADGRSVVYSSPVGGKLWCIAVGPDGKLRDSWRVADPRYSEPLALAAQADCVVSVSRLSGGARCYELPSGAQILDWPRLRSGYFDLASTRDGLLVAKRDGLLGLYEAGRSVDEPVWTLGVGDVKSSVLGVSYRYVVLQESIRSAKVLIVGLGTPGRKVRIRLPKVDGRNVYPIMAAIDEDLVLLTCSRSPTILIHGVNDSVGRSSGLLLAAVDAHTGEMLWGPLAIDGGDDQRYWAFRAESQGAYVTILRKPVLPGSDAYWRVLDKMTGETVGHGELPIARGTVFAQGGALTPGQQRYRMLSAPVVVDRRVLVASPAGVTLFSGEAAR